MFGWDGVHLGTILPDEAPANVAWGGDGRTLYMTANTGVYRITLGTGGTIPGSNPTVVMETTHGAVTMELFQDQAPISVANFVRYVYAGFYEDTIFHRVIEDFMIQGGGLTADLNAKFTRESIRNEAANGLANERGTVAMARTAGIDSATSQFFINTRDNQRLDHSGTSPEEYGYAVFGPGHRRHGRRGCHRRRADAPGGLPRGRPGRAGRHPVDDRAVESSAVPAAAVPRTSKTAGAHMAHRPFG